MWLLTRIQLEIEQRTLVMMNGSSGSRVSFQSVEKVLRKGSGASRIIRGKSSSVDLFSGDRFINPSAFMTSYCSIVTVTPQSRDPGSNGTSSCVKPETTGIAKTHIDM